MTYLALAFGHLLLAVLLFEVKVVFNSCLRSLQIMLIFEQSGVLHQCFVQIVSLNRSFFAKFVEELLGVRPTLRTAPCADVLADLVPVLAVESERSQKLLVLLLGPPAVLDLNFGALPQVLELEVRVLLVLVEVVLVELVGAFLVCVHST